MSGRGHTGARAQVCSRNGAVGLAEPHSFEWVLELSVRTSGNCGFRAVTSVIWHGT